MALLLERELADRGDRVRALVRNPDHGIDVERAGAEAVVCDLEREDDLGPYVDGADAVVFAAGAGPGSGPERKRTVDLGGAVKLIEACEDRGVKRYAIVSSIGAHDPKAGPEQMRPYLEAKADADRALMASSLDWTVVRPGSLTDEEGTGRVLVTTDMSVRGPIPRGDVAATLAAVLHDDATIGKAFVLIGGETPIDEALKTLA